ncbi:MAG: DNA repair protein RecN [Clostridia bacterium]|nr:DNA repair protein RecN [Clostridia bacterium]
MLQTLKIENVALIEKATLHFDEKLNVISGETGAGKSIMLDSLSFVFGGRADKSLIRTGASSMKVEAIFTNLSKAHTDFIKQELNISAEDEMFLSREIDLNGKNICKINGELVPVAMVKKICQQLVDIHGQSEHLAILNNDEQLRIIDLFSKNAENILQELSTLIESLKEIEKQINSLGGSETEKQNLIDLYSYQIAEIEKAEIKEDEFETLSQEKKEMQQFEKINQSLTDCYQASCKNRFSESAEEKMNQAIKSLQTISEINPHYQELLNRYKSALLEIEDLNATIKEDINNNIFDEERFEFVDNRLDFIKTMFRKYGGDYQKLTQYYVEIKKKLDLLINSQERYNQLNTQKERILEQIDNVQQKLSLVRKKSADILKKKIEEELHLLGMPNAKIDIQFDKINDRYSYTGFDRVEYMFSANIGFELKPMNKVVSGGEMSRVMLAYKIVVSEVDNIHTIVFDEIDTGLSGKIASVVAEYMARLSKTKQILAVSHLPQICAMADRNIKVEKSSDKTTTHTQAVVLKDVELFKEIARLMGASDDEKGIEVCKDLKQKANEYKEKLPN